MRMTVRLLSETALLGLAALAMQACVTPAQNAPRDQQGAKEAADLWVEAAECGEHAAARAAEGRLEKIVGGSQVEEWKLYAVLSRWAHNLWELETGRHVYTEVHPDFVRTTERDRQLKGLLDNLIARARKGSIRAAVGRVTEDLVSLRTELVRDVERLHQTHVEGAPALVAAKRRLTALDEVTRRVKVINP